MGKPCYLSRDKYRSGRNLAVKMKHAPDKVMWKPCRAVLNVHVDSAGNVAEGGVHLGTVIGVKDAFFRRYGLGADIGDGLPGIA